ncbi:ATP-binding cassette domain-containing protein [Actinacidiphila acidipaludis]|uniref:ATP-binding protein n=1 Tax=Actinacidiphila acidipaludis TaxID=2873382 RepID=A0ABS7QEH0_9ACTN|nr:ABC transporter ATP-binding protein [Streptomyces acidipaludis]MBY8881358.1 hypothetical protein [Streptomyces acidipaludis]
MTTAPPAGGTAPSGGTAPGASGVAPGAGGTPAPPAQGTPTTGSDAGGSGAPETPGQGGAQPGSTAPPSGPGADRVAPGEDASAATDRLGQGSHLHNHLRNAFANVEGDVVGGDKFVYLLGGRRDRLRPLSPALRDRVRFAYEDAPGIDDARTTLRREGVVILRGPAGSGKTAAAVRLLTPCRGTVYHLDSQVDVGSLVDRIDSGEDGDATGIESGAGFLLDRPADAANLRGDVYQRLQTSLLAAGALMVVTLADTDVADSEVLSGVVDLTRPPAPRGIVRRYLQWRLGGAATEQILADRDVETLLSEHLGAGASCRTAADLATALHDEFSSGDPDLRKVRDRMARKGLETFEIWADGLTEPPVRCLSIALAVLNGLPQEEIAKAARALLRRLDGTRSPARPADDEGKYQDLPPRDPTGVPLRKLLARLRAHRVPAIAGRRDGSPTGRAPVVCLAYQEPDYPRRVITHAWTELSLQDVLVDWLGELVAEGSQEASVYAAVALGGLLAESFPYISEEVLSRWAHHSEYRYRNAAGYALAAASRNPALLPDIRALVGEWYADRSRPLGQAAAARVYGLTPLAADMGQSINALSRLSQVDHVKVAVAIGYAYTDLLAEDDVTAPPLVLGALRAALEDPQKRPTCLLAFLIVAVQSVVDDARPGRPEAEGWPMLLFLRASRPELVEPLRVLWREALSRPFFNRQAERTLKTWAGLAEADERLRAAFLTMLADVVSGDRRSAAIVRRCAETWTDREELAPLPLTAWAVNRMLVREGLT